MNAKTRRRGLTAVVALLLLAAVAAPADAGQNRRGLRHWEGRRLTNTFNRHAAPPSGSTRGGARQPRVWRKGDLSHAFNGTRPRHDTPRAQHNLNPPPPNGGGRPPRPR